ncbi:hypothetical protein [Methyloprofundus sedimenti]|nr:hypothetical protein [Methyloprofundus sedimenti]
MIDFVELKKSKMKVRYFDAVNLGEANIIALQEESRKNSKTKNIY